MLIRSPGFECDYASSIKGKSTYKLDTGLLKIMEKKSMSLALQLKIV